MCNVNHYIVAFTTVRYSVYCEVILFLKMNSDSDLEAEIFGTLKRKNAVNV